MGWWSLYKWFAPWSKTYKYDAIGWYKRYLYDCWYASLSEEGKRQEDERKAKKKRENEEALYRLLSIPIILASHMSKRDGYWPRYF